MVHDGGRFGGFFGGAIFFCKLHCFLGLMYKMDRISSLQIRTGHATIIRTGIRVAQLNVSNFSSLKFQIQRDPRPFRIFFFRTLYYTDVSDNFML